MPFSVCLPREPRSVSYTLLVRWLFFPCTPLTAYVAAKGKQIEEDDEEAELRKLQAEMAM